MRTVGLIVNPVAGMGGSVGLKGTDGDMHQRSLTLGARPISPARTREFLAHVTMAERVRWLAAPGIMGADYVRDQGLAYEDIGSLSAAPTPADTRRIARSMVERGAELLVFAGGDGTARDILDAVGVEVAVIAIPSGVKIYSSVFAYNTRAAAELFDAFVEGTDLGEEEVLDIDEQAFREGRVDSRHYGFLLVPEVERLLQAGKESCGKSASTLEAKQDLAAAIVEEMEPDRLYLLGSGTTLRAVADVLGIEKTLLGIDAVLGGGLVGSDLNERGILELLDRHTRASIIVTPLGGNGFLFGRGNKQFTPEVLRRVGRDKVIVMASRDKLLALQNLHIDSGSEILDETFRGYIDVVVGRGYSKTMRVE